MSTLLIISSVLMLPILFAFSISTGLASNLVFISPRSIVKALVLSRMTMLSVALTALTVWIDWGTNYFGGGGCVVNFLSRSGLRPLAIVIRDGAEDSRFLLLGMLILSLLGLAISLIFRRRVWRTYLAMFSAAQRCHSCGYSLQGLSVDVACPECGSRQGSGAKGG